jgi:8-oxo-dGTP diphosphatase
MAEYTRHDMPYVRVDLCVFALMEHELQVLLIKRAELPQRGAWALPGGALRIDIEKTLDDAAKRVARERLGVPVPYMRQQVTVGGFGHYEPGKWAMSVVFRALVRAEYFPAEPGKRVADMKWVPVDEAQANEQLAFGHAGVIAAAARSLRQEVEVLDFPFEILDSEFTLGALQAQSEAILGTKLDKSSFRKRLANRDHLEPTGTMTEGGAWRPAQLYRVRKRAT